MLQIKLPLAVKLVCGFICSSEQNYKRSKNDLIKKFGEVDFETPPLVFNFTDYYASEMGQPLFRWFVAFKTLINPSRLAAIKLFSLKIEKKYAPGGKRTVNIDPGYLNAAKLVLATTKDFAHRIYLGKGIYAEVTLFFKQGKFRVLPTTFPDYRTSGYQDAFQSIRKIYCGQIKSGGY